MGRIADERFQLRGDHHPMDVVMPESHLAAETMLSIAAGSLSN